MTKHELLKENAQLIAELYEYKQKFFDLDMLIRQIRAMVFDAMGYNLDFLNEFTIFSANEMYKLHALIQDDKINSLKSLLRCTPSEIDKMCDLVSGNNDKTN
ncbi:MAG: hypothetical protein FWG64_12920 [Firmicutes bacterium]|nr:hypothetical protein [Bacillota bacterium]